MDKKFNGDRLKDALQFRGLKMTELSAMTDISRQSLSLYANNENNPPYENVLKIAEELDFPYDFFMTEDLCTTVTDNTYFRSQAAATKKTRKAQVIRLEYVAKMYEVLLDYVDFPAKSLPTVSELRVANNPLKLETPEGLHEIEAIASQVRKQWGLGKGPIDNLQYELESHGIVVTGFRNVDSKIDAFSQRIRVEDLGSIFIIALALGEKPRERLRFDMAHELGHILMHAWGESNEDIEKEEFNLREKQANIFAGALLLPAESFGKDVAPYATNIDFYRSLKKKWGVSMQAMMYRARQLEIITSNQFQYMMRLMSKRGNRKHEPGDVPGKLGNTIFQGAIDLLIDGEYKSADDIKAAFARYGIILSQKDMEELMGLRAGTLNSEEKVIPFLKVRKELKQ